MVSADAVIAKLGLIPHPEGGHYRETFRDTVTATGQRAASSAILFLLKAGERSRWHRVLDAAEVWHWHAGMPLELAIAPPGGRARIVLLGADLAAGQIPQAVVPAGHWQQAAPSSVGPSSVANRVSGKRAETGVNYALVGCTVAPAFLFDRFEMAPVGFEPEWALAETAVTKRRFGDAGAL